jgi:hypothetical protein
MRTEQEIRNKLKYISHTCTGDIEKNVYSYGKVQLLKWVLGENTNKRIKITSEIKKEMIKLRKNGMLVRDIAKKFGFSNMAVTFATNPKANKSNNRRRSDYDRLRRLEKKFNLD